MKLWTKLVQVCKKDHLWFLLTKIECRRVCEKPELKVNSCEHPVKWCYPLGWDTAAKTQWIVTFPTTSLSHAWVPLCQPLQVVVHAFSKATQRKLRRMPLPYSWRRMANFIHLLIYLKNAVEKGGKEHHWKGCLFLFSHTASIPLGQIFSTVPSLALIQLKVWDPLKFKVEVKRVLRWFAELGPECWVFCAVTSPVHLYNKQK